jgi:hypothetical protein
MKTMMFIIIFLVGLADVYPQGDCPGSIARTLSNGLHKWYWNGNLNNIEIRKTLGGQPLNSSDAANVIRSAIEYAAYIWRSETQGAIQLVEGTANDHDIPIYVHPMDMDVAGNGTGGMIQVNSEWDWTDEITLVNAPPGGYPDIYTVFIHEMGHIFGANHSNSYSVMNYVSSLAKRTLTNCDKSSLVAVYNPMYYVTVRNDFAGGKLKVDYTTYTNVPLEGLPTFNWRETSFPHNLYAFDNQFATDEIKRSWKKWNDGKLDTNYNLPIAREGTFEAQFYKIYNVTFKNNFVGVGNGGTITVNGQNYSSPTSQFEVREDLSISVSAVLHTINGIDYTFSQWNDGNTSNPRTFYPSENSTYTANFTGKPTNSGEYVNFGSTVGQPIVIYWTDNPNTNVTQYQIWRRVKHNGVVGADTHIGTVNRGVQTFTDYSYLLTASYSADLIWYDVRAFYSVENTYSDSQWSAVFGEYDLSPKINEENYAEEKASEEIVHDFKLYDNYPDPFNPTTTIKYQLPEAGMVTLKVYDILGREVVELVNENKSPGYYEVNFDASKLTSGVYIYTIQAGKYMESKKMILAK